MVCFGQRVLAAGRISIPLGREELDMFRGEKNSFSITRKWKRGFRVLVRNLSEGIS